MYIEAVIDVARIESIVDISLASNVIISRMDSQHIRTDRCSFVNRSCAVARSEDWRVVIDVMDLRKENRYW